MLLWVNEYAKEKRREEWEREGRRYGEIRRERERERLLELVACMYMYMYACVSTLFSQ